MFRATVSAGRWLGVTLRVHMALPALLLVAGAASVLETGTVGRGVGLWSTLLLAVLTRELARGIALIWYGLPPRTVILLPFGGVVALAPGSRTPNEKVPMRGLTLIPVVANLGAALLLAGFSYAVAPGVALFAQPWISLHHLLRSLVWTQLMIGAINLLPAATLPSRQLLRTHSALPSLTARHAGPAFALGTGLALALMLAGFVLMNLWFVLLGCLALLGAQLRGQLRGQTRGADGTTAEEAGALPVREVMLTDYRTLPNSAILSEALEITATETIAGTSTAAARAPEPQDVYPVVQGDLLVGAITRATMTRTLRSDGDGYVQRDMLRRLPVAHPDESLGDALRRAATLGRGDFVPVVEGDRVLGILTPQSLASAMEARRRRQAAAQRSSAPIPSSPDVAEPPHLSGDA